MSVIQLQSEWQTIFAAAPSNSGRAFLASWLAYRIQDLTYGGPDRETRRMPDLLADEGGDTDLAKAVGLAERPVSRQLRPAHLAPGVFKRLAYKREVPAVTLLKLTDVAALPWHEQPERVFD